MSTRHHKPKGEGETLHSPRLHLLLPLAAPRRSRQQSQKTVFFITHSIPEAVFLSDRVMVMPPRPGRLVEMLRIELPRPRHLSSLDELPSDTSRYQRFP